MVAGLCRRHPGAAAAFHQRYVKRISGMLYRILGPDPELADVLQDCFVRVLGSIEQLREPSALDGWVMGVTVLTAKTHLQRRVRRSWLRLWPNDDPPEASCEDVEPSTREALRVTYRVLDRLSVDERLVFVLRHNEQLTVAQIGEQLSMSASTVKRRLARAEQRFLSLAQKEPALSGWLENRELTDEPSRSGGGDYDATSREGSPS
jgi:RNA polymerase sigma-70 factor (ECF subfamily)